MAKWRCEVCGYVHEGQEVPAQCPVCSADRRRFKLIDAGANDSRPSSPEKHVAATDSQRWQCAVCGYIHTGAEPPETCPVCGADRSKFMLLEALVTTIIDVVQAPSPVVDTPSPQAPGAGAFWDRYQRWIDIAIDNHAHPIAVHIPNGVVPVTVAMVLLAALFDWSTIGQAGVYNMGFIFLSMPAVLFTGYLHWQYKFGGKMTDLFKWKIICGGGVFVLSFILFVWGIFFPESARDPGFFYLLLHIVMLGGAGVAGWLGGKLVFQPKR